MKLLLSTSLSPFRNLALEDQLLDAPLPEPVLLFYRNSPCVVIGKHQNPWLECNLARMRELDIPLARRVSGGGAVYHDKGNLNVAFLADLTRYDAQANFQRLIDRLADFGIRAERSGVSNLVTGGKKFSGNAFAFRRDNRLHHGTLLLNTNLQRLNEVLAPPRLNIQSHAIRSEPAPVTNLHLQWRNVIAAFGTAAEIDPPPPGPFETWEWIYGKTPRFTHHGREVRHGLLDGERFHP